MSYPIASPAPSRAPLVLTVAGSDSCGGAGVQADQRTFHAFGARSAMAITALTAQNPLEIRGIVEVAPAFVLLQLQAVLAHEVPGAVKTGMLASAATIDGAAAFLAGIPSRPPLVVDPVMIASSGARLLPTDAIDLLVTRLLPLATIVTPNLHEAAILTGRDPSATASWTRAEQADAAARILEMGPAAVLVKGGHRVDDAADVLARADGVTWFDARRVPTTSAHGTGCVLSAGIGAGLALGWDLLDAIRQAKEHVTRALARGLDIPTTADRSAPARVRVGGAS
jgi:hydroxymethylpyrimidine/phosphomethylpyrimidine kinase